MKKVMLLGVSLMVVIACHSQSHQKGDSSTKNGSETTISQKTPKGNWEVHKKFDENGNLIAKDSIYTYSWSSKNGTPISMAKADSLFQRLHSQFQSSFGMMDFPRGFDVDSLQNSFFNHNFSGNFDEIRQQMMKRMQALQEQFMDSAPHNRHRIPEENNKEKESQQGDSDSVREDPNYPAQQI